MTYTGDDDQRAEVRADDVVPMAKIVHHAVCLFEVDEVERPHEYDMVVVVDASVTKVKTRCRYFKPDETGAFVFHSNLDYATADLFAVGATITGDVDRFHFDLAGHMQQRYGVNGATAYDDPTF